MKIRKPLIKRGPFKTFLFFLGFSTMVWIFVQFSKEYTEAVELPISYINVPKDKILSPENPSKLDLRVKENGLHIAFNRLFPKVLYLDVSDSKMENGKLIYNLEEQKSALLSQLNLEYDKAEFLKKTLNISYQQREVKKVPIRSNLELDFAVGYSALDDVEFQPDSIMVSGPKGILDTLSEVQTKELRLENINNDISGTVNLDTAKLERLTFYQTKIDYTLRTDKFTEGKVQVSIDLVNVPEGMNVVIFPKEVTVIYQVSLKKFNSVKKEDFRVMADFKNAVNSDGYLLVQLTEQPPQVNNVRLNEKKIQFVIKR
ncbi:CdaR family protein [Gillisia sp. Hel1_33_143]|uniref:CdaR family protein n=1 Tax=Gillisia sp. Hel1_33_143 TaxID=1336796 RepID=UPI001E5E9282|nr:YbbR-like domain-containing protein [Gillisia sp. Hel1_33_143]